MKTTSSILSLIAITTLLHAAPPKATVSPEDLAKGKVATEIYAKVNTYRGGGPFSRADPGPSHRLDFQPQQLVDGEQRLPFTIRRGQILNGTPTLQGYVRVSDQAIFLLDPATGKHRPASEDPRFAPPKPPEQQPATPRIEPAKPV